MTTAAPPRPLRFGSKNSAMDLSTLVGTALGAILGVGSTLTADRSRWKREHTSRERVMKRELYSEYLAALALATHKLRDLRRPGTPTPSERMSRAGEVLSDSGAYQLRYQIQIGAPETLEEASEQAFDSLRKLRDRFDEADVCTDPGWDDSIAAVSKAIEVLKLAMRDDLST